MGKNIAAVALLAFFIQQLLLIGSLGSTGLALGIVVRSASQARFRGVSCRAHRLCAVVPHSSSVSHGKAYYLAPIYPVLLADGSDFRRELDGERLRARCCCGGGRRLRCRHCTACHPNDVRGGFHPLFDGSRNDAIGDCDGTPGSNQVCRRALPTCMAGRKWRRRLPRSIGHCLRRSAPRPYSLAAITAKPHRHRHLRCSKLGLPPAISGHNNYWIWGPRGHDGSVVIEIGGTREKHLALFGSVEFAGWIESPAPCHMKRISRSGSNAA